MCFIKMCEKLEYEFFLGAEGEGGSSLFYGKRQVDVEKTLSYTP